ncbi:MAG: hypothetical protein FJ026_10770 [Chloroflexi bacterium]|nr:hypothetical protein [Chloroflexota bacterium]
MSERWQRVLWTLMALVAVGLGVATVLLFHESRQWPAVAEPAYRIAYTSWQDDGIGLWTCNLRGQDARRLTPSGAMDSHAAIEPRHSGMAVPRVAFLRVPQEARADPDSGAGTLGGVYVMSAQGGEPVKVSGTLQRIWVVSPCWLGDGKHVVFAALEDVNGDGQWLAGESGVYVSDIEARQPRPIARLGGQVTRLACSPTKPLVIATFMLKDRSTSILLGTEGGRPLLQGAAPAACWSPDGAHLAAYLLDDHKIHILDTDGSELSVLSPPGEVIDLLWLPLRAAEGSGLGGQLLATATTQQGIGAGQMYLRAVEPPSAHWQRLGDPSDYVIHMAPSPDGRYVAYTVFAGAGQSGRPAQADLYLLDLDTMQKLQLTSDEGFEGLAAWIPWLPQ